VAINVPLTLLLVPRIGSAGACIATTCGYLVALIIPSLFSIRDVLGGLPALRERAIASTGVSSSNTGSQRVTPVLARRVGPKRAAIP
jgi:hypothetical protein